MTSRSPTDTTTKPILVLTVGMDERKQAIFRTAFKMHKAEHYELLTMNGQRPDLILIDADVGPGWRIVELCQQKHSNIPLLVLATQPAESPYQVPVLQKPIRVETLFPKLREVLTAKPRQMDRINPSPKPAKPTQIPPPPVTTIRQPQPEPLEKTETVIPSPAIQQIERFDPHSGLLGQVLMHYKRKRNVAIGDLQRPMFILLSEAGVILLLQPLQQIKAACQASTAAFPEQIIAPEQMALSGPKVKIQALIWQMALWSAHGRLILNITPDTPLRLRHWPNLTRLAQVPEALRLSAFLTRTPVSLRLTHRMLGIPLPNIIDFIAATYAIGLLEDPAELQATTPSVTITAPVARQHQGNLLSRLLRKVIGL